MKAKDFQSDYDRRFFFESRRAAIDVVLREKLPGFINHSIDCQEYVDGRSSKFSEAMSWRINAKMFVRRNAGRHRCPLKNIQNCSKKI